MKASSLTLALAWLLALPRASGAEPAINFDSPFSIGRYALTASGNFEAPSGARANHSGCCYVPGTGELMVILNRGDFTIYPMIMVYTTAGKLRRQISMTGFDDAEGICLYDEASNQFAIIEEGTNDITVVTIATNTTSIAKSAGRVIHMNLGNLYNLGTEGVTYDPASNVFYAVKEKTPMAVYRVENVTTSTPAAALFDAQSAFGSIVTDLSDVHWDAQSGHLLVLSDEGHQIIECDLQGTILATLPLGLTQPEGLVLSADRRQLIVVGEPYQYAAFAPATPSGSGPENSTAEFLIRLSEPSADTVTVDYAVSSGTATAGTDFEPASGTVAFAPGELSNSIAIHLLEDLDLEPPESFRIALTNATHATVGYESAFLCTIEDRGRFEWTLGPEPKNMGLPFAATITARDQNGLLLSAFTNRAVLSAAVPVAPTNVSFFAGGIWTGAVTVLQQATNLSLRAEDGYGHSGTSTAFTVGYRAVHVTGADASEADGVRTNGGVVSVSQAPDDDLAVSLTSLDTTEVTLPATVIIPAQQTEAAFDVTVMDDGELDGTQWAGLAASAETYLGTSSAMAVHDSESAALSVTLPATASERDGVLTNAGRIAVSLPVSADVSVALLSSDATELAVPAAVTVPAGQTSAVFHVTVVDDSLIDGTQTAWVSAHVQNWVAGSNSIGVLDNEMSSLTVTVPATATEGQGQLSGAGQVSIGGTLDAHLAVTLASDDLTELATPAGVTILAGQTSALFSVTILDDDIVDGVQTARVTASAMDFATGSGQVAVRDNEAHHFLWAPISSPQTGGVPFTASIWARDMEDHTIATFTNRAALAGSGARGAVALQPTNTGAFAAGQWTGSLQVLTADAGVRLTASAEPEHNGSSAAFTVVPGPLHHFDWKPVWTQEFVNHPFSVTVAAKDSAGNTVTAFTNGVAVTGWRDAPPTNTTIGSASDQWSYPMHTSTHDARTQVIYLAGEIGGACSITALALDVVSLPGQTLSNWTVRLKHTPLAGYGATPVWETGWTTAYSTNEPIGATGWRTFVFSAPFSYNGTDNLMLDLSHNNASASSSGSCQCTQAAQNRTVYQSADSWFGDPLGWPTNGFNPNRRTSRNVPNLRLSAVGRSPVAISPTNSGAFAAGVWGGSVTVLEPATNMQLRADDGAGHASFSAQFSAEASAPVTSAPPASVDLLPATDTGTSAADDRTARDNGDPSRTLQFSVGGTVSGALVTVLADGVQIGSAQAPGAATLVTTDGAQAIADGTRAITGLQRAPGGSESAGSPPLHITVDTEPPAVSGIEPPAGAVLTSSRIEFEAVFSEAVAGFDASDIAWSGSGGEGATVGAPAGAGSNAWRFPLAGLSNGTLALALAPPAGGLTDEAGNDLAPPPAAWEYALTVTAPAGTPIEWLMAQGFTNNYPEAEEGDQDGDGAATWEEYIAGTEPTNSASVFVIGHVTRVGPAGLEIRWQSASNRAYAIDRATALLSPGFAPLTNGIPATPPVNTHTDAVDGAAGGYYYRVRIQPP